VSMKRSSAGRAAAFLPIVVAASLAGCGSSAPLPTSNHTVVGVKAEAEQFLADLQNHRYKEACEAFTAHVQAGLAKEPGGCAVSLPRLYLLLGGELSRWYTHTLPKVVVQGDTALARGVLQGRYENGRWHLAGDVW